MASGGGVAVLLVLICSPAPGLWAASRYSATFYRSAGKKIAIEVYSPKEPAGAPAVLILSGAGGWRSRNFQYADEAGMLAGRGYRVYLPDYLAATNHSSARPDDHYPIWVRAIEDALGYIREQTGRVALIGYSLGGSVALAVATQNPTLAGVICWSGSLPDRYFHQLSRMPHVLWIHGADDRLIPVSDAQQFQKLCAMRRLSCEMKLFPRETHVFSPAAIAAANQSIETFLEDALPIRP
jgi:dienelactone hydrolase